MFVLRNEEAGSDAFTQSVAMLFPSKVGGGEIVLNVFQGAILFI